MNILYKDTKQVSSSKKMLSDERAKKSSRQRGLLASMLRSWKLYLALLPGFLLLLLLNYYPAVSGLYFSFFDWRPGFDSPFLGLTNYATMLHDAVFWHAFANIGLLFVFGITAMWLLPLLAAELVITLSSPRWQYIFRSLLIAPLAFPLVVQILLWGFIYDPNVGLLNALLRGTGLSVLAHNWLGDPSIALFSFMFMNVPWVASVPFLFFLARLQAIPKEIFDAAALDGASRWQRVFVIDLPLLGGQLKTLLTLAIIQFLQAAVAQQLLTNGGPDYATMTPGLYTINSAFVDGDWGYAATLSATIFLVTLILSLIVIRFQRVQPVR